MKYWVDKDPMTEIWVGAKVFTFCRFILVKTFTKAIARHEHYLATQLNIKSGMKVLDVGCGVDAAREICQFSGAHITGINNNDYQISRAIRSAARIGLENKTNFIKPHVHAPKLEGVLWRSISCSKTWWYFAFYEWCVTDKYDPNDPEHRRIIRGVEYADVVSAEDMALNDDTIPWYYPLEGDIRKSLVGGLEKVGIAPAGSFQTQIVLETAGDCLVEGGKLGILLPICSISWYYSIFIYWSRRNYESKI
ncbi:unnamed protein product [Rhizophagus irregularis]|nr:unnamed protein product [Rhizophagus irregularis]